MSPLPPVQLHVTTINPAFMSLPSLRPFHQSMNLTGSAGSLSIFLSGTRVWAYRINHTLLCYVTNISTRPFKRNNRPGLERWPSSEEHRVLQKTWVQFLTPLCQLTTFYNSSSWRSHTSSALQGHQSPRW